MKLSFPSCRWLIPGFLVVAVLGAGTGRPRAADEPGSSSKADSAAALQAAQALYDGISTETLSNGLRVYLKPIPGAGTVTTMVAYKVGSSDEDLNNTGLSHYLEHLMFKGTDKIMPGDIDRQTFRGGGANNAYTSEDFTVFHFDFPSDRWDVALQIEADRMRNLRIDTKHEFEQEKGAVVSELKRNEDSPWDLEQKAILPMLFGKKTPYGHPVIGEAEHVFGATAAVIKAHYDKWYHPNNAALVICGGFDPDRALTRVKELFGPIPAAKLPERKQVAAEKQQRPARLEMESKFESPRLIMGYNTVPSGHPDCAALDVLSSILTGGKTGRLYKKLVESDELATDVNTTSQVGRYPGWFGIMVEQVPAKERTKTEGAVLVELKRLADQPVSAEELHRVQEMLLTGGIFGRESAHSLADSIAQGVTVNDLDYLKGYLPSLLKVTAADIQRVARKYLDPEQRVVVWSYPKKKAEKQARGAPGQARTQALNRSAADQPAVGSRVSLKDTKRVELPNGMVLLLYEDHRLPIVVADAAVRNVSLLEPAEKSGVATLTGYLLDEGTAKRSGPQIAELIENAGATMSFSSGGGTVRMLNTHRKLGLELLLECLSQANFPKDEFARQKTKLLAEIDDTDQQPVVRGQRIYRELVYGKHPYGRPALGKKETVEKLTPADCSAFFRRVFVPNNTMMSIVGDFDSQQVTEEIKRLTADWKQGMELKVEAPEVQKPPQFIEKIVSMPSADQLNVYMGHVGIRRNSPDYYKLLVMDYVLGTGPGLSDRLSARLRDREGLAYTVSANISRSAGEQPGVFTCYIGTDPDKLEKVKAEFLEEINRIRDTKPDPKEVEDAKMYLLGNLPFEFTTIAQIASQLIHVERNHLGFSYIEDFRKGVAAVTPENVQAVAKKYLDPQHMVLVVTGPVDEKGKPLTRLPAPKP